jgi:hypothetical protein
MPGLTLTLSQASRLFSIEPTRCERVLGARVEAPAPSTDGKAFASFIGLLQRLPTLARLATRILVA